MRSFVVVVIAALFLMSCDSNRVFEDYHTIGEAGWHKDTLVVFDVELAETKQNQNIYINVRNKGNYANSNLWLFIAIDSPSGELLTDTIEFSLAEASGKWKGSGIGDLYDNQFLYQQNVFFPEEGQYRFSIRQGMRTDLLKGIQDIGIRIEKQN